MRRMQPTCGKICDITTWDSRVILPVSREQWGRTIPSILTRSLTSSMRWKMGTWWRSIRTYDLHAADPGFAAVHLFRFDGDRIVELWDVGQPVPEESPNENGVF